MNILQTVMMVMQLAAEAVKVGKEMTPYAVALIETFKGGTEDVTQEQLDELVARVTAMHNEFQEPLA